MKYYDNSHSEAGQESFVLNMLNEKREGFFVEIGAYDSTTNSNTFLLESEFGWRGFAIEINPDGAADYNKNRKSLCANADAITFDYETYFDFNGFPKRIDYLQVDIEPAANTLLALKKLPLNDYRFSVITFEHDLYFSPENQAVKDKQVELLTSLGYVLAVSNVKVDTTRAFEDWWIDPEVISPDKYSDLNLRY